MCFIEKLFMLLILSLQVVNSSTENQTQPTMSISGYDKIFHDLFDNYSKTAFPSKDGNPVNVSIAMGISDMVPLDLVDMHYSMTMYFRQYWHDYRLESDLIPAGEQISLTGTVFDTLWVPDIYFKQVRKVYQYHEITNPNMVVRLKPDGSVYFSQRIVTVALCNMDLTNFPFDVQTCQFEIQSYGHTVEHIRLSWKEGTAVKPPTDNRDMLEFTFDSLTYDQTRTTYGEGYFDMLYVKLTFKRNYGYYLIQMYLPCILVVILSWVGFWIDYRSTPARVSLGITTVLTMVTLSNSLRSSVPTTDYSKSLDYYAMVCLFYVFAALLEFAVVGITDKKWKFIIKEQEKRKQKRIKAGLLGRVRKRSIISFRKNSSFSFTNKAFDSITEEISTQTASQTVRKVSNHSNTFNQVSNHSNTFNQINFHNNNLTYFNQISNHTTEDIQINGSDVLKINQKQETNIQIEFSETNKYLKSRSTKTKKKDIKVKRNNAKFKRFHRITQRKNHLKEQFVHKHRSNQVHILDQSMKKIFPITFLIFNVAYFTYSFIKRNDELNK